MRGRVFTATEWRCRFHFTIYPGEFIWQRAAATGARHSHALAVVGLAVGGGVGGVDDNDARDDTAFAIPRQS